MEYHGFHETRIHGTKDFLYSVYHCKVPDFLHNYPLHFHEEFEIIAVTAGAIKICAGSKREQLSKGGMAIILPSVPHSISQVSDESAEYFNILFSKELFKGNNVLNRLSDKYITPFVEQKKAVEPFHKTSSPLNEAIKDPVASLISIRHESYDSCELLVLSNLLKILYCLNEAGHKVTTEESTNLFCISRIRQAVYLVQNRYRNCISVEDVARECGYSPSHFMKKFKDATGLSFVVYLNNYRLDMALEQIIHTTERISDICSDCGFNDPAYFATSFKKRFGCSPSLYRKNRK